jgi:hypothetical protein
MFQTWRSTSGRGFGPCRITGAPGQSMAGCTSFCNFPYVYFFNSPDVRSASPNHHSMSAPAGVSVCSGWPTRHEGRANCRPGHQKARQKVYLWGAQRASTSLPLKSSPSSIRSIAPPRRGSNQSVVWRRAIHAGAVISSKTEPRAKGATGLARTAAEGSFAACRRGAAPTRPAPKMSTGQELTALSAAL